MASKGDPVHMNTNLTTERPTFVTHLECSWTGEIYEADQPHNLSRAGKPLLVRYDLDGVRASLSKQTLAARPNDRWDLSTVAEEYSVACRSLFFRRSRRCSALSPQAAAPAPGRALPTTRGTLPVYSKP